MSKVIGIDLGTTNSCVAVMEGDKPKVIENLEGVRTTPSVVGFTKDNTIIVGASAKRQAITNPENTIYEAKRLIGKKTKEISEKDRKILAYSVVDSPSGDAWIKAGGSLRSPEEISAQILMKLKQAAESHLGQKVTKAVITVPAYFNDQQREATKNAGKIAGLEVLRIINEPTAAAIAYGLDKRSDANIAVYDLGGGTFDVSVLEKSSDGTFEVKSTNGDTNLGGGDFDNAIMSHLLIKIKDQTGVDLRKDSSAMQRLKEACEKAKIELSSLTETDINLPYITVNEAGPQHFSIKITRSEFESMVLGFIDKTLECCEFALKDAGLSVGQINSVLLVGGQTRMPLVVQKVKDFFGKDPDRSVNPDEVVALGAAVQAGVLTGQIKDILLLDVTPLSLGIETLGGICSMIISRNTTIPTKKSQIFSTAADNQTSVSIKVYQGESEIAERNKFLGEFNLDGIPSAPRGVPQIEVTFDIDANSILDVSAKDMGTGKQHSIRIESGGGLSDKEIEKIIKDNEANAEADKKKKDLILIKNESDALVYSSEKVIAENGDKIDENDKSNMEKCISELKEVLNSEDIEDIRGKFNELKNISMKIGESIYSAKSTNAPDGEKPQDDAKDAEFKDKE